MTISVRTNVHAMDLAGALYQRPAEFVEMIDAITLHTNVDKFIEAIRPMVIGNPDGARALFAKLHDVAREQCGPEEGFGDG